MYSQTDYRLVVFFTHAFLCVGLINGTTAAISLDIRPETDDVSHYTAAIARVFPASLQVRNISYNADVCFRQEEFDYLVDIKVGDVIHTDKLCKAIFYLTKKQKFALITLSVRPVADTSVYDVHFDCVAFWTFRKMKLKGVFVGKEQFRQLYALEYGERFDERRHEDSLQRIRDALCQEGYFDYTLGVDVLHDSATKSVTVKLNLQKGSRFFIEKVTVQIDAAGLDQAEMQALQEVIQEKFERRFSRNYYTRELITGETNDLKTYLARRGYLHVDIAFEESHMFDRRQVNIAFKITISYKKKFSFTGNQFFARQELLDVMLVFGKSTSLLPASILSEELEKAYHRKGFWSVEIKAHEKPDEYHFSIHEGSRAFIQDVQLRNLTSFDADTLKKKFFSKTVRKRLYDAGQVQASVKSLLAHLLRMGFWQAELLREYVEPVGDEHAYNLILIFDEGRRSFLRQVTVDCPHIALSGPFKQCAGATGLVPFDVRFIDEQREWLVQQLHKEGYYQPRIKPEYYNDEGHIDVHWSVDLKDAQARFDKTILLGSTTFPFGIIKRELDYRIGDVWHPQALRHSVSRLKKMEVFESVHLIPDKDVDGSEKVMLLKLQKDDPFEIKMRLGLGAQHVTKSLTTGGATYRIGGSFIYKNPFNAGDQLRFDADFTRATRLVNGIYRRPWICGLPVTAEFQGYTNRFEYPGFIGSQKNLYTVVQQGFLANFAGVYSHVDTSVSSGFEVVDTCIDESTVEDVVFAHKVAQAIHFRPDLLDKNIPYFQLQPTIMLYFLDNTINPTRGSFSVLSAKGMFPLAKLAPCNFFIRVLAEQSFFVPIKPFVLAMRLRVGHIFHPQLSTIMPIERFYLGGANSIRSYETDQCPPLGLVTDADGKELYVPQGGRSLVNATVEVRFPLYNKLGGVFFSDVGALSANKLTEIRACDMLSGVGFGLRYNTPIGPLRFDFAWRGHKRDGVGRPYAWFLSFGNAFI